MKKLEDDLTSEDAMNAPLHGIERMMRTQGREMLRASVEHSSKRVIDEAIRRDSGRPGWMLLAHKSPCDRIHIDGEGIVTRGFVGEISRWSKPEPEPVIEVCNYREACVAVLDGRRPTEV